MSLETPCENLTVELGKRGAARRAEFRRQRHQFCSQSRQRLGNYRAQRLWQIKSGENARWRLAASRAAKFALTAQLTINGRPKP